MDITRDQSFNEQAGRVAGALYLAAGVTVALWTPARGEPFDSWTIAFLLACTAGAASPLLMPWDRADPEVLHRINMISGAVTQAVFAPFWYQHPPLMVLLLFGAVFAGATLTWPWLVGQMVPALIVLGVVVEADEGLRAALADLVVYAVLWTSVGVVPGWLRHQVSTTNAALLEAQAAEAVTAAEEAKRRQAEARQAEAALAERTELVTALQAGIEAVSNASAGIEDESANIARAVDQLAESLDETADAAGRAESGLQEITAATTDSIDSIARLDEAGREIVGIVDTITELSEQTNLLALNATIEAARAGEAGKGFAVVANEVKDLAARTARSASGIGDVVDHIQTRLTESSGTIGAIAELVRRVGDEHASLTTTVTHQSAVVGEISQAASHGVEGVTQISQAIRHLDEQAASLAEGATSD